MFSTDTATSALEAYETLAALPLHIERLETQTLELAGATSFTRLTTEVQLSGAGHTGRGEDPSYSSEMQRELLGWFASLEDRLVGDWTFESYSACLDSLELTPTTGQWTDHPNFQRWAFESAGLDLALRQSGLGFAQALGREQHELRFCISMGLGSPPSLDRVHGWIEQHPRVEFKLDASREWDTQLIADLAATEAVRVVDIKGMYTGDWIDNTPDPELYERISHGMGEILIEDPKLLPETRAALGDRGLRRVSWDAPLHSVSDLTMVDEFPSAVNIKPSRFGTVRELLGAIDWCNERKIPLYAGGQYEIGWGRSQAQQIAAVFYANAANDIAPAVWHTAQPGDDVPQSPLKLPDGIGFGFEA